MSYSILYPESKDNARNFVSNTTAPEYFKDLHLDQIFGAILKSEEEYALDRFFYTPLRDLDSITYRQKIFQDLENPGIRMPLLDFSKQMNHIGICMAEVRKKLSSNDTDENTYLTRGELLDFADRYCRTLEEWIVRMKEIPIGSPGLTAFIQYGTSYLNSPAYSEFKNRVAKLRKELSEVNYCMLIQNGRIRVRKYEGQSNLGQEILNVFAKFRQGRVNDYRKEIPEKPYARHIEAAVLNMVAEWYKPTFKSLLDFTAKYLDFTDETMMRFAREIRFYLSWLDSIAPLKEMGFPFCYPNLLTENGHLYNFSGYDLALAKKTKGKVVANDFELIPPERFIVVTGPNQGGKTTFARTFGQLHYLSSLGLCVPGKKASLLLFDNILTHFGREEDITTLNGKLQDDLIRLKRLLARTTARSILVINEIFASTTLRDALFLGGRMMDAIASTGAVGVCVTFLDELAEHGPETVSMMSTVDETNPVIRTFRIVRKPPDGLAYAVHIAEKHGLTYSQLSKRLRK
ncbi:MAG: Endonuclease MutS2 [Lentisphaerae bacterium ADurb.Bin242]|nr:MAG: Endonuclease MutS2 [Lentisphaerae bacterium ADurb.Bin242]